MEKVYLVLLLLFGSTCISSSQSLTTSELRDLKSAVQDSKPDSTRVKLLLELSRYYIFKPGEEKADLDSSLLLTKQAETLARKIDYKSGLCTCMYQYSAAYREQGDREKGKSFAETGVKECLANKQYKELGEIYFELTQYYSAWDSTERVERIELLLNADSTFKLAGNKERQADVLKELGDLYQIGNNSREALRVLKNAQLIYESIGYKDMQGVYDLLGNIYTRYFTDFQSGIKYGLLALSYAEEANDTTSQLGTIHLRLGFSYLSARNYEAADYHLVTAYNVFEKYDIDKIYDIVPIILTNLNAQEKYQEAFDLLQEVHSKYEIPDKHRTALNAYFLRTYIKVNDRDGANKYCDLLLADKSSRQLQVAIVNLIQFFIVADRYTEADQWLKIFAEFMVRDPKYQQTNRSWYHRLSSSLAEKRGNYRAALEEHKKFKEVADSIHNTQKSNQTFALQIEYEAEQKDQEIKLKAQDIELLKTQAQIQEQSIRQSSLIRNFTFAGAGVLLVFLGLIYNQYRIKATGNKKLLDHQDEIHQKNQSLQNLVQEKEWLLKEVHHRVKNNLQIVLSLLESQSTHLQNDALIAMQTSQNRVYAMSLIHQKLYQTDSIGSIEMNSYLRELISYLRESFESKYLYFDLHIAAIHLDVSQAVAIGLIVNEAITNSIKYAFPDFHQGTIAVLMENAEDDKIRLIISDNGIGFSPSLINAKEGHFGLKLMNGLTEDIAGQFSIESSPGTKITIEFVSSADLINSPAFAPLKDYL